MNTQTTLDRTDCARLKGEAYGNWYWRKRWKEPQEKIVEAILEYRKYREMLKTAPVETNARGNLIYRQFDADKQLGKRGGGDRYWYDFEALGKEWKQFDTDQDASYFGVWVDLAGRRTFTYAEGDRTLVECPSAESFKAELEDMERFYGPLPYCAIGLDAAGQVTKYYDPRPPVEG